MSNASLSASSKFEAAGVDAANSRPITLGTSYTELLAATTFDWEGFFIAGYNIASSAVLSNIAIGASAAEQDIVEDILMSPVTSARVHGNSAYFPIRIPAGTRISGIASVANAARIQLHGCSKAPAGYSPGAGKSFLLDGTSGGTLINPGSTANTKGAYSEITSSLSSDISGFVMSVRASSASLVTSSYLLDIAVGSSSSEVVILPDMLLAAESISDTFLPEWQGFFPISIPAGTRVAARAQSNVTGSNNQFYVNLHGIPS